MRCKLRYMLSIRFICGANFVICCQFAIICGTNFVICNFVMCKLIVCNLLCATLLCANSFPLCDFRSCFPAMNKHIQENKCQHVNVILYMHPCCLVDRIFALIIVIFLESTNGMLVCLLYVKGFRKKESILKYVLLCRNQNWLGVQTSLELKRIRFLLEDDETQVAQKIMSVEVVEDENTGLPAIKSWGWV